LLHRLSKYKRAIHEAVNQIGLLFFIAPARRVWRRMKHKGGERRLRYVFAGFFAKRYGFAVRIKEVCFYIF